MKKLSPRLQALLQQYGVTLRQPDERHDEPASAKVRNKTSAQEATPLVRAEVTPIPVKPVDPLVIVRDTVMTVRDSDLRDFLQAVVSEPEIRQVLTTPGKGQDYCQRYAIEYLRRAAGLASFWCLQGRLEREVIYTATLVRGLHGVLAPCVVGGASVEDVVFTIVRPALHRLDDCAPHLSGLLRLSLGWGNADEIDDSYIPAQQQTIRLALQRAGLLKDLGLPVNRPLPN